MLRAGGGFEIAGSPELVINACGDFVVGWPHGDNGLSGKRLMVDFYGPWVPIGSVP
jgi:S-adenosylmethionine synthetase